MWKTWIIVIVNFFQFSNLEKNGTWVGADAGLG